MVCARCGHRLWLVQLDGVEWGKCVCGSLKPLTVLMGQITIEHVDSTITLPRRGTRLSLCLGTLAALETGLTEQVAAHMQQDSSTTASQLGVLRRKGLIQALHDRKGCRGGSLWELTAAAKKALKLK